MYKCVKVSSVNVYCKGNFRDWGGAVNAQSNLGTGWRTLSSDEWNYLISTRPGAIIGTNNSCRYAFAVVNDVNGIILFPDGLFTWPNAVTPMPTTYNVALGWNDAPRYNTTDWSSLESAGCVFLPAAGECSSTMARTGNPVTLNGEVGCYWSSTTDSDTRAYLFVFMDPDGLSEGFSTDVCVSVEDNSRGTGCSVRLVRDIQTQN